MGFKNIIVEREERLLTVTINRPKAMNAIEGVTAFMEKRRPDWKGFKNSEL